LNIVIKEIKYGTPDYEQEVALRDKILRKPLGLKFSKEELDQEVKDIHLAAYVDDKLVGCLILTSTGNSKIRMRQVAIDESAQGLGIGRRLVEASEAMAKKLGFFEIELNARDTAVPFYLKLGYTVFGEPFTEVTIPHRKMYKLLK
jgi:predicted GNAT family N-acyltransferase